MMVRTQLSMDRDVLRRAKRRAAELGVSLAEYVRTLIARDLGGGTTSADPSAVFDLGSSGGSDVAGAKDRMIAEALASRHKLR
jgi:hypothetical protein